MFEFRQNNNLSRIHRKVVNVKIKFAANCIGFQAMNKIVL